MSSLDSVLHFGSAGKLEKLCLAGCPNILHEYPHEFDLGGKHFRPAGWDECFPTIDPYQGNPVMGELVGREPLLLRESDYIQQTWQTVHFTAQRIFLPEGEAGLTVVFRVTNHDESPLEFLWASHALFSTNSLLKMQPSGGLALTDFSLNNSTVKCFHANTGPLELVYPDFRAVLTTDQPWWGIWVNRGGWPAEAPQPFCCLGIEATNTPGECPAGSWLSPAGSFEGWVKINIL